jgi:hypothetical protein
MTRQYTNAKAEKLKRTGNHIRQNMGSDEELRQLGGDYLARPLYPIIVSAHLEVYDGNRRLAGVLLTAGPEAELPVCITDELWSEAVKLEIQMESAAHTRSLSAYEMFVGCKKWLELNTGATAGELARRIHVTEAYLSKLLSLDRCIPAVKEAAAAGKIGLSDWYAISRGEAEQATLLAAKLNGATRDELESRGRKARNGDNPAVRVSRVKCAMPSGVNVSFAGAGGGLSLDDLIDTLGALLKECRKAQEQGLDSKTFQAVLRDKAKAGA